MLCRLANSAAVFVNKVVARVRVRGAVEKSRAAVVDRRRKWLSRARLPVINVTPIYYARTASSFARCSPSLLAMLLSPLLVLPVLLLPYQWMCLPVCQPSTCFASIYAAGYFLIVVVIVELCFKFCDAFCLVVVLTVYTSAPSVVVSLALCNVCAAAPNNVLFWIQLPFNQRTR